MIYNEKHNRWISKCGLVYRYSKSEDKLVLCNTHDSFGYERISLAGSTQKLVHRLVWETFKGEIPEGLEIDHIDNNRKNNRLDNLQLVTRAKNEKLKFDRGYTATNESRQKISEKIHNNWLNNKPNGFFEIGEFGKRFIECYGKSDTPLYKRPEYHREHVYFKKHGCLKGELNGRK